MQTIEVILRALACVSGLILIYAALWLYPAQRGGAQSKLEDWWLDLAQAQEISGSRALEWVHKFARTALRVFRFIYGPVRGRRFTTRLVAASMIFSIAPIAYLVSLLGYYGPFAPRYKLTLDVLFPVVSLGLWMWPPQRLTVRWGRWWSTPTSGWSLAALVAVGTSWSVFLYGGPGVFGILGFGTLMVLWMLSDLAAIFVTSVALRLIVHCRSVWRAIGWLAVDAGSALSLFIVPALLGLAFVFPGAGALALGNLTTVVPSLAYFLVALVLVLHAALWHVLLAPLFNVFVDAPLLYRRKTLGTLGVALLGVAGFSPFVSWLEQILGL